MDDKIVTLASYYDAMEAQIVRGRLEANDIPCFIADDNMLAANPFYNQALGGVKIKVFEHDLDVCRKILSEEIVPIEDEELTTCPYCKSTNVHFGAVPVKRNWLSIILTALISTYPIYLKRTWICRDCGASFIPPEKTGVPH